MRIGQIDRLNDPFELLSVRMNGKHERFVFKLLREHWIKTLGVICMGKHWKSPVMWAHYADNHKGVCLGFDIEDCWPKQMKYEPERMEQLIKIGESTGGLTEESLELVLTTKYEHWAYEEEWRLLLKLSDKDPINGEYYLEIGPKLILREIIVGARCPAPVGSFRKLVGQVAYSVTVIKARAAFESFTMVRQNAVSAIVISPKREKQSE
jgi:hypothetical protein